MTSASGDQTAPSAVATLRGRALSALETIAAPLAIGAALSLTQAPASAWPILFFALPLVAWLLERRPAGRAAAALGWWLGVGYFLPGLLWIGEAFLVEAERFAWARPFAVTLLPMGLALFWAAGFWAAARLGRDPLSRALALVLCFGAAEVARSHVLTGFPWGLFAYAWIDAPVAQAAAWIGPYALNLATLFAALALYFLFVAAKAGAGGGRIASLAAAALGAALLIGAWSGGAARLAAAELRATGLTVRLVQPNIPQKEKWAPEHVRRNFAILLSLSGEAPAGARPDVVVWPESATPYPVEADAAMRRAVMTRLPQDAWLVFGAIRRAALQGGGEGVFNSLVLVAPGPEAPLAALYDKHHLVPFGEYLPFQNTLEALGVFQLAGGRGAFSAGPGPRTLAPPGLPAFAPLICYEAIFPHERAPLAERPEWLLQVTNDAWFGDSSGPRQHLAQARFRAIEQGLPLYRSANTGISAGIDPYGRLLGALALGRRGVVDAPLVSPITPPPYMLWGEAALIAFWLALMLAIVAARAQRST